MINKLLIAAFLVVILLMAIAPSFADGGKRDNACDAGGVLAGQCTTEWHYFCGWYLERFLSGPSGNGLTRWNAANPNPYLPSQVWYHDTCWSLYEPYYDRRGG